MYSGSTTDAERAAHMLVICLNITKFSPNRSAVGFTEHFFSSLPESTPGRKERGRGGNTDTDTDRKQEAGENALGAVAHVWHVADCIEPLYYAWKLWVEERTVEIQNPFSKKKAQFSAPHTQRHL
jgi:hypothetical protein